MNEARRAHGVRTVLGYSQRFVVSLLAHCLILRSSHTLTYAINHVRVMVEDLVDDLRRESDSNNVLAAAATNIKKY